MTTTPKQYDFGRNWKKKISPLLDRPGVVRALFVGMGAGDGNYKIGDPPWQYGRAFPTGRTPKAGCLSWYQPLGMCHYIAPFCWELGLRLFPALDWGFLSGDFHTVVIGWADRWDEPEWVMDILNFKTMTAEQSLDLVKLRGWEFHPSFARYAASMCPDPESAYEKLRPLLRPGDTLTVPTEGCSASTPVRAELMASA